MLLTPAGWYITFQGGIPKFIAPLCESLNLKWSIIKNSTEGSTGTAEAARNKFRERFMISLPTDLNGLPDLSESVPPTNESRNGRPKRNAFDALSTRSRDYFLNDRWRLESFT